MPCRASLIITTYNLISSQVILADEGTANRNGADFSYILLLTPSCRRTASKRSPFLEIRNHMEVFLNDY